MDTQHLKDGLLAAHTALVEKIGKQPYMPANLLLCNAGLWQVRGCYLDSGMNNHVSGPRRDTPEDAIAGFMDKIHAMPNEAELDLIQFRKLLSAAIDFGSERGIEAKWVNPVIETARALASNALPPAEGAA